MALQVITREGDATTVNTTWAELTTLGSSGTMPRPQIEKGIRCIKHMLATVGDGVTVITACGGPFAIRLRNATRYSEQVITVQGWGTLVPANSGVCRMKEAFWMPDVNIAVDEGKELIIEGAFSGVDSGTPTFGVTLFCTEEDAGERYYISRLGTCTAIDTDTACNGQFGTATTGNITVPCNGVIERALGVHATSIPLNTAAGGSTFITLRNEGGFDGPDIVIPCGSQESMLTTTGNTSGVNLPIDVPLKRVCKQGGVINARVEMVGVDLGSTCSACTVCFRKG